MEAYPSKFCFCKSNFIKSDRRSSKYGIICYLIPDEDIVDWNVNDFNKESNCSHHKKSHTDGSCNLGKLFTIRFGALFDQMHRILGKLLERLNEHLVESFLFRHDFIVFLFLCYEITKDEDSERSTICW
jgi:hypothetical protein